MKRLISLILAGSLAVLSVCAQPTKMQIDTVKHYSPDSTVIMITVDTTYLPTYDYAVPFCQRDTGKLMMYVYQPTDNAATHPCVLYIYGGGFAASSLLRKDIINYCRMLADRGIVVAAMDYRLGLKDYHMKGGLLGMIRPTANAIEYATEDCMSAIKYLRDNASSCRINPDQIVLVGSSAGAISALQTDYELCNRIGSSSILPDGYVPAGIISYSGAIYSHAGQPKYSKYAPAPTMWYHGTLDKLVFYNKFQFFKTGMFGPNQLVRTYDQNGYPYYFTRVVGHYHDVADYMTKTIDDATWFINEMVIGKRPLQIDRKFNDPQSKPDLRYAGGASSMYK